MLITITVVALGVSILTAVLSYLVSAWSGYRLPSAGRSPLFPALLLGMVLTLIIFGLTIPTGPPFSPGLRLGWGVLIGGIVAGLAVFGMMRLAPREFPAGPFASGWAFSLAVAAVSLTLLLFRGDPEAALLGCALGFGMVVGICRAMVTTPELTLPLEAAGVLSVILAATSALAVHHFDTPELRNWWAYPLALAGAWVLTYGIAVVFSLRRGWPGITGSPILAGILTVVLVVVVGGLVAKRLDSQDPILAILLMGLVTAGLIIWLARSVWTEEIPSAPRYKAGALSVLMLLFLIAITFKLMQAFGTAISIVAAFGVIAATLAVGWKLAAMPVLVLITGANYLLVRLFLERVNVSAQAVQPDIHYTLIGLLLGVLLPFLYVSLWERPGVGRALVYGVLALGSPLLLAALWGMDATVGFLGGLVIAPAAAAFLQTSSGPVGLLSLGMALVAAQFGLIFETLYHLPRLDKIYLAGGIALLVVGWIGILGLLRWRAAASETTPQEG